MERRGSGAELLQELPGFRFHPTEQELLEFYLKQVAARGRKLKFDIIPTVHLYRHDPWDLPALATVAGADSREWYFFVPRDVTRKQHQQSGGGGGRPSRTTERGFWKATGSDRAVRCAADPRRLVGLKKTLVYYEGRAPRGTKTDWVMNEYRLPDAMDGGGDRAAEDVVLCKVYRKAVSLKELEQRVAMEELARSSASASTTTTTTTSTPTPSHSAGSSGAGSISSAWDVGVHELAHHHNSHNRASGMKEEEAAEAVVVRPAAMRLPQLEVATARGGMEWLQDPFLTQLRSPWMESLSPYYASVLNF